MSYTRFLGTIVLTLFITQLYGQADYSTKVYGVCGMCEQRIEKAVIELDFVSHASWDVEEQLLSIDTVSGFSESHLHQKINAAGHDTELSKATDKQYGEVHGCCKYRDPQMLIDHGLSPYNIKIPVSGVCEMCKDRIEQSASGISFVQMSEYVLEEQTLYVFYQSKVLNDKEAADSIAQKLASIGHDAAHYTATDEAYQQLHDCCKYRDLAVVEDHAASTEQDQPGMISGTVKEQTESGKQVLILADVYTVDQKNFTTTDTAGNFQLEIPGDSARIVIDYTGYDPDTLLAKRGANLEIVLSNIEDLQEVVVTYDQKSSGVSSLSSIKTFNVNEEEFLKAACCNLAESFETLSAVDVGVTDAVTGTRQIKMLGLSGPNILYTREQIPMLQGISAVQGISLIPGTWIEGMNLNQGLGSVAEGYQSISGQINVELRKPENMDPVFLNLYANEGGRFEGNAHLAHRFSEKWSTGLLVHGNIRTREMDRNNDQFLDAPTGEGFSALNRWKFHSGKNLMGQAGVKYAYSNNISGQLSTLQQSPLWRSNNTVEELQAWLKTGYIIPNSPNSSIALRMGVNSFDQNSLYANRTYQGRQSNFHGKLLYQGILGNPNHKIRSGIGINIEETDEELEELIYTKSEIVPNAFAEYTLDVGTSFSAIAGLRYDLHNIYGGFLSPRLHLRYALPMGLDFRLAAGQARRMASVIAENLSYLASSRSLVLEGNAPYMPYGLPMIESNNVSVSADYGFELFKNDASLSLDYFFTHFEEHIIADWDQNINQLKIYAQEQPSYGHNFQLQLDVRPAKRFDVRLAYKFQNLFLGYEEGLREAPFTPRHRGFLNMAYQTTNDWSFDLTFNLTGPQRIPDTDALPTDKRMDEYAPTFVGINGQISKELFSGFTIYTGVENLTNFQQEYAIIDAENPFSDNFDASLIWGPTMGRNIYLGIRYTIREFDENKFEIVE